MLYELLYTSVARWKMSSLELTELLEQSRKKNLKLNITGLLVYYSGEFIQVLEGEKNTVLKLYDRIANDERHTSIKTFWEGSISERGFSKWAMTFVNTENVDVLNIKGYSQFLREGFSSADTTHYQTNSKKLLLSLRDELITTLETS